MNERLKQRIRLARNAPLGHAVHVVQHAPANKQTSIDKIEAALNALLADQHSEAKRTVTMPLADLGFEAIDIGGDPAAMLAVEALGDVIRLLIIAQGRGPQANLQVRMLPKPDLHTIGQRPRSAYN